MADDNRVEYRERDRGSDFERRLANLETRIENLEKEMRDRVERVLQSMSALSAALGEFRAAAQVSEAHIRGDIEHTAQMAEQARNALLMQAGQDKQRTRDEEQSDKTKMRNNAQWMLVVAIFTAMVMLLTLLFTGVIKVVVQVDAPKIKASASEKPALSLEHTPPPPPPPDQAAQ